MPKTFSSTPESPLCVLCTWCTFCTWCTLCRSQYEFVAERHIQRTMHTPSDSVEECFTCKKEFSGYWNLMNRRRVEYPSKRKCRCFLKNECNFDDDKCWYRHEFEPKYEEKTTLFIPVKNVTKPLDTSLIWWNTKKVSSR